MKVKTNLTPTELTYIGKKLQTLAKQQQCKSLPLENDAEKELIRRSDHVFSILLDSLQKEISAVLLGKGE